MTADVNALAIPMADELAAMDLVRNTPPLLVDKACWLDTTSQLAPTAANDVRERAITYLTLRGRLTRHPQFPNLVRIQGVEHVQSR